MGFTLHWIDSEWKLQSRNLGTKFAPDHHTAEQLTKTMNDMLAHWKLVALKQIATTADNGSNIKKPAKTTNGQMCHVLVTIFTSPYQHLEEQPKSTKCVGCFQEDRGSFNLSTSWKRRKKPCRAPSSRRTWTKLQEFDIGEYEVNKDWVFCR